MSAIVRENTNAIISAAAVIILIFGMQAAKVLLVPFLLAIFLALITVRPMLWMQKRGVPAVAGALIIVVAMMLVLAAVATIVGQSFDHKWMLDDALTRESAEWQSRPETTVNNLFTRALDEQRRALYNLFRVEEVD